MNRKTKKGFTLVEIMIVVAVIGLLATIAIPSFMRARQTSQTNLCINNLRMIEAAKDQWAMETGRSIGDVPAPADIEPYVKNGVPDCPLGGAYIINGVDTLPICPNRNAVTHDARLFS